MLVVERFEVVSEYDFVEREWGSFDGKQVDEDVVMFRVVNRLTSEEVDCGAGEDAELTRADISGVFAWFQYLIRS